MSTNASNVNGRQYLTYFIFVAIFNAHVWGFCLPSATQ
jgi:hypothetical protein